MMQPSVIHVLHAREGSLCVRVFEQAATPGGESAERIDATVTARVERLDLTMDLTYHAGDACYAGVIPDLAGGDEVTIHARVDGWADADVSITMESP